MRVLQNHGACITGQRIGEISSKKDIDRIRSSLRSGRPQQIWNRIKFRRVRGGLVLELNDHQGEDYGPPGWRLLDEDIRYL